MSKSIKIVAAFATSVFTLSGFAVTAGDVITGGYTVQTSTPIQKPGSLEKVGEQLVLGPSRGASTSNVRIGMDQIAQNVRQKYFIPLNSITCKSLDKGYISCTVMYLDQK